MLKLSNYGFMQKNDRKKRKIRYLRKNFFVQLRKKALTLRRFLFLKFKTYNVLNVKEK